MARVPGNSSFEPECSSQNRWAAAVLPESDERTSRRDEAVFAILCDAGGAIGSAYEGTGYRAVVSRYWDDATLSGEGAQTLAQRVWILRKLAFDFIVRRLPDGNCAGQQLATLGRENQNPRSTIGLILLDIYQATPLQRFQSRGQGRAVHR